MWTATPEQAARFEATFDPPDVDLDTLSDVECWEQAKEDLDCEPCNIAAFIGNAGPDAPQYLKPRELAKRLDDGEDLTAPELLALAMNDSSRAVRALFVLRGLYRANLDTQESIGLRADEIEAAQ